MPNEGSRMGLIEKAIETLLNEHDVARITGLSVASVRRWRLFRQGPKYLKIGAAVFQRSSSPGSSRRAGGISPRLFALAVSRIPEQQSWIALRRSSLWPQ